MADGPISLDGNKQYITLNSQEEYDARLERGQKYGFDGGTLREVTATPASSKSNSNSNNTSVDSFEKNKYNIYFSSIGYTNPKLGFVSRGLTGHNLNILKRKLNDIHKGEDLGIKTYNYEYTTDVRDALLKINPTRSIQYREFNEVLPRYNRIDNQIITNVEYENVFHPTADTLFNFNNYRFIYKHPIPVLDGYYYSSKSDADNNKPKPNIYDVTVAPALFNPLFMVQYVGITPNTPLLNIANTNTGVNGSIVDVSDCRISTLVKESKDKNSILGLATYRYVDFMYCKDLGKISNNHLITLRKFAHPIGDNIFEYYEDSPGDVGKLVTWFGTEDNKLEDILNFTYRSTWKELKADIEQITSREDNQNRGLIGIMVNSAFPAYNESMKKGHTGEHNIFGLLGINRGYSDDNNEILRNYDQNKVYTPKNTIQDTVTYEGKLEFTNDFKLTFCYKLRAYDNINPRSAFLDLIGNIMAVTYRRGQFWGGARKMIGPPQNVSAWKNVENMINEKWKAGENAIMGLIDGTVNIGEIFGSLGNIGKELFNKGSNFVNNLVKDPEGIKETMQSAFGFLAKNTLDGALGQLKNKLGRPALYAMNSLLKGDNVGLWHVTIGNPKNPIAVMGNLILDDAQLQISGPLGLDDFPSEIKVTCNLKHARSRDAVEIGRMFTKGTNGIYYTYLGKGRPGMNNQLLNEEMKKQLSQTGENDEMYKAFAAFNAMSDKSEIEEATNVRDNFNGANILNEEDLLTDHRNSGLFNNNYDIMIDQFNQRKPAYAAAVMNEIAS